MSAVSNWSGLPRGSFVAWLAGATGLVGRALLDLLLDEDRVGRVTAVTRRPTGRSHPKLDELVTDLGRLEDELEGRVATHVFCCLGTTIAAAGSEAAFRRVDLEYPLRLARAARKAGARKFLVVTSMGADPRSRLFYSRVKGELEVELDTVGIPELHVFRPSLLLGERTERRPGERLAMALARPAQALLVGPLRKFRPIRAEQVARAMLKVALAATPASDGTPPRATTVHQSDSIAALGAL